jgi:chemotaxis protein MotB
MDPGFFGRPSAASTHGSPLQNIRFGNFNGILLKSICLSICPLKLESNAPMTSKLPLILLLLTGIWGASCVPRAQYVETENRLQMTEARLQEADRRLQTLENEKQERLEDCEAQREKPQSDLEACREVNAQLSDNIKNLAEQAIKLKLELEKHRSVVTLQDQVIKLLDDTRKTIESSLKDRIAAQDIELVESEDQLRVVLVDRILYDPGSLEVSEEGKKLLLTLADTFRKEKQYHIVVEGHSDNLPLSERLKRNYPTNWELSAARAASVVRFLEWKGGIEPERLSLRAYSYHRPVASHATEEGRRQNRRIEILLGPPR